MTRNLRIIAIAIFIWGLGEGVFIYFLPLYLEDLGAFSMQIGLFLGLAGAALALAHILAGTLAYLFGRKIAISAACVTGMIAAWLMFFGDSLPFFILGMILYFISRSAITPMSSYIIASRGKWTTARKFMMASTMFNAGLIVGPLVGGTISEQVGLRITFGLAASLFALSTAVITLITPQPSEQAKALPRYFAIFNNATHRRFLLLSTFILFAMYLSWPLTPNFMRNERGVSLVAIGIFGAFNALGIIAANLTLGRFKPQFGILLAHSLVAFSIAMIWLGTGSAWFALGYFLAGAYHTSRLLISSQMESLANQEDVALVHSLVESTGGFVLLIAAPLAGVLYYCSPELPYTVSLTLIGISLIAYIRFAPRYTATREPFEIPPDTSDIRSTQHEHMV